jgi:hypothetical protein
MRALRNVTTWARAMAVSAVLAGLHASTATADASHFEIDWAAAEPTSYDHATGDGGTFSDVVESLEGADFVCGDVVVFFAAISVAASETEEHTVEVDFGFFGQPTGGEGVGFVDVVAASANGGDPNHVTDGDEAVSILSQTGGHPDSNVQATVQITSLGVDDDQFILRVEADLGCTAGEDPTGNLGAGLTGARVTSPDASTINTGQQSIPLQGAGGVAPPPPPPTTTTTTSTTTTTTTTTSTTSTTAPAPTTGPSSSTSTSVAPATTTSSVPATTSAPSPATTTTTVPCSTTTRSPTAPAGLRRAQVPDPCAPPTTILPATSTSTSTSANVPGGGGGDLPRTGRDSGVVIALATVAIVVGVALTRVRRPRA